MTTTMTSFAVSVGVADIRRCPDAASELVTQALMNAPVAAGEVAGEWTHATLSDYTGWLRSDQLEEPVNRGFCKVGEHCRTPLQLMAVINKPRIALFAHADRPPEPRPRLGLGEIVLTPIARQIHPPRQTPAQDGVELHRR